MWWVDNEGSASCLVRGNSSHWDAGCLAHLAHLLWAELRCRVWIEWINTKSNPSDGLSRLGLTDPWTLKQGWHLVQGRLPAWSSLGTLVSEFASSVLPADALPSAL